MRDPVDTLAVDDRASSERRPGRPRPGLTPAAVVAAGRRVIERGGLDALTMRSVAAELDTAATSLYRHVVDREALLLAIMEQIAEGLPIDVPGRISRTRLERRFIAVHDYLAEHIWVLHILIDGELVAEAAFAFVDACLADFLAARLTPLRAMSAYRACWHLTIGELLDNHPLRTPSEPNQRQRAIAAIDEARFPTLARVSRALPPVEQRPDDFPRAIKALLSALLPSNRD
jgi:AcrR family transcriptional regulator